MKIGITSGDPSGIGPEIILKSMSNFKDITIFANHNILKKTAGDLKLGPQYHNIKDRIIDCGRSVKFQYGKPTQETAKAAMASIDCALDHKPDILITPPIVKEAVRMLIPGFIGHTEYLAQFYSVKNYAMLGLLKEKRIMLLTTHIPISEVFRKIKSDAVFQKIVFLAWGLKRYFGIARPCLAVSALNPHAFEFSKGEDEEILKGLLRARIKGVKVHGPYPADSLFNRDFDGFLAMYHDQAFIYLKSSKGGLNFTLGLPIIRVSPLHGAALDIAGKNVADFSGMITAVKQGIRLVKNSQKFKVGTVYL